MRQSGRRSSSLKITIAAFGLAYHSHSRASRPSPRRVPNRYKRGNYDDDDALGYRVPVNQVKGYNRNPIPAINRRINGASCVPLSVFPVLQLVLLLLLHSGVIKDSCGVDGGQLIESSSL